MVVIFKILVFGNQSVGNIFWKYLFSYGFLIYVLADIFVGVIMKGWFWMSQARISQDTEHFLLNPFGVLYNEVTASTLIKVDMQVRWVGELLWKCFRLFWTNFVALLPLWCYISILELKFTSLYYQLVWYSCLNVQWRRRKIESICIINDRVWMQRFV